jgi:hypothetical protein
VKRVVLPGVVAACVVWAAASCSSADVPLATLPSGDDAAPAPPPPRCASNADCMTESTYGYCDKAACGDPSGTCTPFPPECPNTEMPVCGCDGTTYFNHCLRQQSGVEAETSGPCTTFTCGGPGDIQCPAGKSYCAQLGGKGPGHCSPMAPGICWVLPPQCPPPSEGGSLWDACIQPGAHCLDTCDAIRMGGAYGGSFMCPSP